MELSGFLFYVYCYGTRNWAHTRDMR